MSAPRPYETDPFSYGLTHGSYLTCLMINFHIYLEMESVSLPYGIRTIDGDRQTTLLLSMEVKPCLTRIKHGWVTLKYPVA